METLEFARPVGRLTPSRRVHVGVVASGNLEVLLEHAREVQASMPASNRRGMSELDTLVRAVEDECRAGHAAYMRGRAALIRLCDAVIEADPETSSHAA